MWVLVQVTQGWTCGESYATRKPIAVFPSEEEANKHGYEHCEDWEAVEVPIYSMDGGG